MKAPQSVASQTYPDGRITYPSSSLYRTYAYKRGNRLT